MKNLKYALLAASVLLSANQVQAAIDNPPPSGPVILDLNGTTMPTTYKQYSTSFQATSTTTNLSFAFRDDSGSLMLDNVSMTIGGGANLVTNGDFEAAGSLGSSAPTGWTYLNSFGAASGGQVTSGCGVSGNCYYDGAVGAYDAITQAIATTIGQTYNVSFWLNESNSQGYTTFSSTGADYNAVDMVVYAGAIPGNNVPEPASLALLGIGVIGLVIARRRK